MRFLIILLNFLFAAHLFSQDKLSYEYVNEKTYEYFMKKKWDELISLAEKSVSQGIDFYNLRYRLGIAYFNKERYFSSIKNLNEVFSLNPIDDDINKYLYKSFILTGNPEEAELYFSKISEYGKNKIRPLNNPFANSLFAESGYAVNNDFTKNQNIDVDGNENFYGEQILNRNYFYFRTGLKQIPFERVNIKYNYSYLNLNKTKVIQYNNQKISDDYSQKQNQFYNEVCIIFNNGFKVSPAGNYLSVKDNTIFAQYDSAAFVYDTLTGNFKPVEFYYSLSNRITELSNFIISLDIEKRFRKVKTNLTGSFSYLNNFHQTQIGSSLTYFPHENMNFYTSTLLTLHFQNDAANLIFSQNIRGKISKNFCYDLNFTYGKMENYNEQNGSLVFNNPEIVKSKASAEIIYNFPFNLKAYLSYQIMFKEKKYSEYKLEGYSGNYPFYSPELKSTKYNTNIFLLGLNQLF